MTRLIAPLAALTLLSAAGCEQTISDPPYLAAWSEPEVVRAEDANAPPNARPGSCWGRDVTPAVLETVTEQIMVQPPEVLADGTVITPGIFRTEQLQRIIKER
ncbi:MAG: peptidoglycan-binding protein, partial [Shimia sp.]|nr:peptidoglycan-binding protein [Shimia sp.]